MQNRKTFLHTTLRTRLFMVLAALSLLSLSLLGCGSGKKNNGGNTGVGGVRGTVFNAANKDIEVENAIVTIAGKSSTTLNRERASPDTPVGSYVLIDLPVGTDIAEVQLSGQTEKQRFAFSPPVLKGGASVVDIYVNIGQIRGMLLRPDGKPAAGAFVTYISNLGSEPTQTDADGKFLFPTVPKGQVRVESQFGPASDVRTVTVENGLVDLGTIKLVETSGTIPGLPYSIKGKVTSSSSGIALSGISVALIRDGIQREAISTKTDGRYQFAVPKGDYTLRVTNDNFEVAEKNITLVSTNQPITADFALVAR
jgi:hypothetical protein